MSSDVQATEPSPPWLDAPAASWRGEGREFGREAFDLDFDFDSPDRLALAIGIVAACGGEQSAASGLPVGERIARLLEIVARTEKGPALPVALRCPCGGALEVSLPFDRLLDSGALRDQPEITVVLPHDQRVALRRPTGNDQWAWRARPFATRHDAVAAIVETLTVSHPDEMPFDDETIAALANAMEEADPLTAFQIITTCPHCGAESTFAVDLEAEALRRLAAHQRALLRDIHTLATRYGWSETEVLAIPPHRRARYLRLIEAAESHLTA